MRGDAKAGSGLGARQHAGSLRRATARVKGEPPRSLAWLREQDVKGDTYATGTRILLEQAMGFIGYLNKWARRTVPAAGSRVGCAR